MIEIENTFFHFECDPKRCSFSIFSKTDKNLYIQNALIGVTYRRKRKIIHLPEEKNQEFAVHQGEIKDSKHGKMQTVELKRGFQDQNVKVNITFALPEKYPMVLWKIELQNLCYDPILLKKFDLAKIEPDKDEAIKFGESNKGPRLAFYANGWQSWSYTATYGADEPMRLSKLKLIQGQQWHNPGTPTPQKTGLYTSEFFAVIGDRSSRKGWLMGFLSQKQQFGSISADLRSVPRIGMWANGDDAMLNPQQSMETDWAELTPVNVDEADPMGVFVEAVARENDVHLDKPKPTGWCSWYEFYTHIDDRKIKENLETVKQLKDTTPMDLFQIDDGYETQIGDWLTCKPTFVKGMKPHADAIREAGLMAGLWQAPLIVHKKSRLMKDHPDWILRKANGQPTNSGFNWNSFTTALDLTHPDALEHVRKVVKTAAKDWGFPYLKLDFLYAGALTGNHKDPTKTRAQVLRKAMEAIREAAGENTFLLGCGAPLGSMPGVVDAMRIGEDVLDYWLTTLFGIKTFLQNEPNAPAARNAIQNTLSRAMLHNRWWINDPDTLLVRQTSHLTLDEIHSLASIIALSGGMLMLSDNLPKVAEDRLRIAQQLIPQMDQRPWVLDWFDRQMPSKLRLDMEGATGKWTLISISNWEDQIKELDLNLEEYQIQKGKYWARSFWDQKTYQIDEKGILHLNNVPAHATVVFALREMDQENPQYLGSDLHISQGNEIKSWKSKGKKLEVEFDLPRIALGQVEFYMPMKPKGITFDGAYCTIPELVDGRMILPVTIQKKARMIVEF
jgi:alpha-galactosidase